MMMGLTNVVVILRWLSFVSFVVKYLTKLTFKIFKIDCLVIVLKLVCWFRSFENLKINIVVKMPPKKLKKMSEEKNRLLNLPRNEKIGYVLIEIESSRRYPLKAVKFMTNGLKLIRL